MLRSASRWIRGVSSACTPSSALVAVRSSRASSALAPIACVRRRSRWPAPDPARRRGRERPRRRRRHCGKGRSFLPRSRDRRRRSVGVRWRAGGSRRHNGHRAPPRGWRVRRAEREFAQGWRCRSGRWRRTGRSCDRRRRARGSLPPRRRMTRSRRHFVAGRPRRRCRPRWSRPRLGGRRRGRGPRVRPGREDVRDRARSVHRRGQYRASGHQTVIKRGGDERTRHPVGEGCRAIGVIAPGLDADEVGRADPFAADMVEQREAECVASLTLAARLGLQLRLVSAFNRVERAVDQRDRSRRFDQRIDACITRGVRQGGRARRLGKFDLSRRSIDGSCEREQGKPEHGPCECAASSGHNERARAVKFGVWPELKRKRIAQGMRSHRLPSNTAYAPFRRFRNDRSFTRGTSRARRPRRAASQLTLTLILSGIFTVVDLVPRPS